MKLLYMIYDIYTLGGAPPTQTPRTRSPAKGFLETDKTVVRKLATENFYLLEIGNLSPQVWVTLPEPETFQK